MVDAGGKMGLDETSRAIGRLEASQEATKADVATLTERTERMDAKLDKLLLRTDRMSLKLRHWVVLLLGGSLGGGSVAHAIKKIFE